MEKEEMVGYVKYNWFHKEQHKPFKEDVFNQANFYYNKVVVEEISRLNSKIYFT